MPRPRSIKTFEGPPSKLKKLHARKATIIEAHPERARIEYDLARGVPQRVVAKKYGFSLTTAQRCYTNLPAQLKAASLAGRVISEAGLAQLRIDESQGVLQNLAMQRARLLLAQDQALEIEDSAMVARLATQIHKNIELTGRYLGEFAQHSVQTSINVLIRPEYLELRAKIVRALAPFPEARQAVAAVLHSLEDSAARGAPPPTPTATQPASPLMLEATANV
jgi:hypothetical protein